MGQSDRVPRISAPSPHSVVSNEMVTVLVPVGNKEIRIYLGAYYKVSSQLLWFHYAVEDRALIKERRLLSIVVIIHSNKRCK